MSKIFETIYSNHIAEEKLKNGTHYEKLAAVVFQTLYKENLVIHDMRLRGNNKKAQHQIDVTIQDEKSKRRILVECKDYSSLIGIGIVRDFYGAVSQIQPDEALVVSTKGFTKGARDFAEDVNIKLAILREFHEEDWEGRIRKIHITGKIITMDTPTITWVAANEAEHEKANNIQKDVEEDKESINTRSNYFYDQDGNELETYQEVLKPLLNSFERTPGEVTSGRYEFGHTKYVKIKENLIGVRGFDYSFNSNESIMKTIVDEGNRIATLIFKTLDEPLGSIIFDKELSNWMFDKDGRVIPKKK